MQPELHTALKNAWTRQTCAPALRDAWSDANPAEGQGLVTAFALRHFAGGKLVMAHVAVLGRAEPLLHFFNRFADHDVDLTRQQFPDGSVVTELPMDSLANHDLYCESIIDPDMLTGFMSMVKAVYRHEPFIA